jgi:hypothetical protein
MVTVVSGDWEDGKKGIRRIRVNPSAFREEGEKKWFSGSPQSRRAEHILDSYAKECAETAKWGTSKVLVQNTINVFLVNDIIDLLFLLVICHFYNC